MTSKEDYTDKIFEFLETYSKNELPININIRELTANVKFQNRATHLIHKYPAKLLPNIPYFFLNNTFFSQENDVVLDPFSGSGTVLLESILANRKSLGCDANPLAVLISKVKTNQYNIELLKKIRFQLFKKIYSKTNVTSNFPNVININYWFHERVKNQLNTIIFHINKLKDDDIRDFFILCFSNCIGKVSYADQKISVPVKIKGEYLSTFESILKNNPNYTYDKFFEIVNENISRFRNKIELFSNSSNTNIISKDARKLEKIASESVDLIITSPPYAGAQKYIRASSLNIGWGALAPNTTLNQLDSKNIGRENYKVIEYKSLQKTNINEADRLLEEIHKINPLRSYIASNYLIEMRLVIQELYRVLKTDRYFILIAANNKVCGYDFQTQEYLKQIAEQIGFKTECRLIDDIKSYGLMTKRNKTASIITCEWILILKK